jgi:hypothetical protein
MLDTAWAIAGLVVTVIVDSGGEIVRSSSGTFWCCSENFMLHIIKEVVFICSS